MPKGRLYDREGMATMGRQNLETRWVEKLACYYLCVCLLSLIDGSKDSSRAHKGLVTNWPHHSTPTKQEAKLLEPELEQDKNRRRASERRNRNSRGSGS
jgi:hypothetical protein